jgi:hypothetical protein
VPTIDDVNRLPQPARQLSFVERASAFASDASDVVFDQILPAFPPDAVFVVGGKALAGGIVAVRLGFAGERAVRAAVDIGLPRFIRINGRFRIPDGLNRAAGTLNEVKNTASLSFTRQLRDFADFARANGLQFNLFVRPGARLSRPLMEARDAGVVVIQEIPF